MQPVLRQLDRLQWRESRQAAVNASLADESNDERDDDSSVPEADAQPSEATREDAENTVSSLYGAMRDAMAGDGEINSPALVGGAHGEYEDVPCDVDGHAGVW